MGRVVYALLFLSLLLNVYFFTRHTQPITPAQITRQNELSAIDSSKYPRYVKGDTIRLTTVLKEKVYIDTSRGVLLGRDTLIFKDSTAYYWYTLFVYPNELKHELELHIAPVKTEVLVYKDKDNIYQTKYNTPDSLSQFSEAHVEIGLGTQPTQPTQSTHSTCPTSIILSSAYYNSSLLLGAGVVYRSYIISILRNLEQKQYMVNISYIL